MSVVVSENAEKLLKARYLTGGESIDGLWDRVSGGNSVYRELMSNLRFMPNSPTLFNAGLNNGCTSSACFVFDVDDTMFDSPRSIVATRAKAIAVAKAGGGVGYYFGNIRPKGSLIKSVHRKACGPVGVLRDYHGVRQLITQGGKRDLAQMGVLNCDHPDILEFVHCKDEDPKSLESFNISVSWNNIWMDRALYEDEELHKDEHRLLKEQVDSAWSHGCPGVLFFDTINKYNPNKHLGLIYATNPCQPGFATVLTPDGIRTFNDIQVGSTIWSGKQWTKVSKKIETGVKEVFRYHSQSGIFIGTKNHKVIVDGEKIPIEFARTLQVAPYPDWPNPDVIIQNRINHCQSLGEMTVYDITVEAEEHTYWTGRVLVSNCGETPNRTDEPCNLGSINLIKYFVKGNRSINWNLLEQDVYHATCFLDDILDRNVFPHPDITEAAQLTRKLGLGVMGWADLLALMHVHYDTEEAVRIADELMQFINQVALQASVDMAKKKGPYKGYSETKTEGPFCRNETRTSIAPTGSIGVITGCWHSIEPHFAIETDRVTNEGIRMVQRLDYWDELEGFIPKVASEITPEWHVKHQAAFQKHTDLGVSKTINLPNSATKEDVLKTYRLMYKMGCKGGTIYRDGCRDEQVIRVHKKVSVYSDVAYELSKKELPDSDLYKKKELPDTRPGTIHKFKVAGTTGFLIVGVYEDGTPAEIFLRVSKAGSTIGGLLDTWAINFSIALQNQTPLADLCKHHKGTRFEPCGLTNNPKIPICTSIPDYVVNWLESRFVKETSPSKNDNKRGSGQLCPDCGTEVIYQAGCLTCPKPGCNWNRCG